MALVYSEFDTTFGELSVALRNAILASSDWTKINPGAAIVATTAAAAAAATALTVPTGHGMVVGQSVRVGSGPTAEYKNITAVAATTITFASQGLLNAQASGTQIFPMSEILKCTTTRGADMIVDLSEAAVINTGFQMATWRAHDGTNGTDKVQRWLYPKAGAFAATNHPVHCIVSASKDHLFVSVEGPRPTEPGATSAVVGSVKNYFFMDDVVPYHAADTTPVVYAGGMMAASSTASVANNSHQGNFSRNFGGTGAWSVAKTLTLDFPSVASTETVQINRESAADGKFYFSPFVCFGDESGLRGRLASFFHVGFTYSDTPEIATPPVGKKVQYGGKWYKLLSVSKSDGSVVTWGQFGSAGNGAATTFFRTPVVAVPTTAP